MKKLLTSLFFALVLSLPLVAQAQLSVVQGGTGLTSVGAGLCLKGLDALHLTTGACGSGGSSGGTFSTTTSSVSGQLINFPNNTTDIVVIGGSATTTGKFWFDPNALVAKIMASTTFGGNVNFGTLTATNTVTFFKPLSETNGGTNQSGYVTGDMLAATGANTLSKLNIGASSTVLTTNGSLPAWQKLATSQLTNDSGFLTSAVTSVTASQPLLSSGGNTPNITFTGISTSTVSGVVVGQNAYWTSLGTLGSEATGTVSCTGGATCPAGSYVLNSALTINTFTFPFTQSTNYNATVQATTGVAWFQNGLTASSTSYFANATTSLLTVTSNFYGAGLTTCNSGSNALTWNNGTFGCNTIVGGNSTGLSTSSPINAGNVLAYNSSGAGSAYGVATGTLSFGSGLSGSSVTVIGAGGTATLNLGTANSWTASTTFQQQTNLSNASSTLLTVSSGLWIPGAPNCNSASNALTYTLSTGTYGCNTISGSGTVNSGTAGMVGYYQTNGTAISATSSLVIGTTTVDIANVGIGTTTPWGELSVATFAQQSGLLPLFAVGSTTNLSLFTVLGNGNAGHATTSPWRTLSVNGSSDLGTNALAGSFTGTSTATSTLAGGLQTPLLNVTSTVNTSQILGSLAIGASNIFPQTILGMASASPNFLQSYIQNTQKTGSSSAEFVFCTDLCTNSTYYGEIGMNSSIYSSNTETGEGAGDMFLGSSDSSLDIYTASSTGGIASSSINFFTSGIMSANLRLKIDNNGKIGIGTSTPGTLLSVQGIANFDTATSTFSSTGGINITKGCFAISGTCLSSSATLSGGSTNLLTYWTSASTIAATGSPTVGIIVATSTATSTFAGGINLTGGCFSINGTCVGGSGGSGTVNSSTQGYNAFYNASTNAVSGTSTIFESTASLVGVGTTTPSTSLDVAGGIYSEEASSTLFSYDFCVPLDANGKRLGNEIQWSATSTNATVTFTNANQCYGKAMYLNVTAPPSGTIGSTTIAAGSNSGFVQWNGGINPGNSVVNSSTDQFKCVSKMATTTTGSNYLWCTLNMN